ncbi:lysophospholipid acyltransferase family protein [Roseovarius salinarum]|uniref:lysophospholipid acyltransferase family protein n=1 Tax=Roseovarius salinarum TaxID=1981892 RepID=UPI001E3773A7|nr:lysophospholipid acyltransferase family protein [Roseovarius salinarum]
MGKPDDSFRQRAREYAVNLVLQGLLGAARALPYRWRVPLMGRLTARVVSPIAGYSQRVRTNLNYVLPDLPEREIRRLERAAPDNAGRTMIELYSAREFKARARNAPVSGPGLATARAAAEAGKPVIFVSGHFGSFNAGRVALVAQGFEMGVFYRPMSNRYFNRHYVRAMATLSEPMFEQGRRGTREMVQHLRRGGALGVLTDINAHDGIPLDFFGKPALSSLNMAELALKFDAPLVPFWGIRAANGIDFEVTVESPIPHTDAVTMTQAVNDRLEAQVRAHMDQWFWIHRRWKDGTGPVAEMRLRQWRERT